MDESGPQDAASERTTALEAELERHRRSIAALTESESQFRTLLENSPDSITVMDRDGRMLYVNRTVNPARRMEEVVGALATAFMPPEQGPPFLEALRRAVELGETQTLELETISELWWQTRLVPLVREGRVVAVMGIGADITARRKAEAALRKSEERLRLAVEAAEMGLWAWDPATRKVSLDAGAAEVAGLPKGTTELAYERGVELIHREDRMRLNAAAERFSRTGRLENVEIRLMLPDGGSRWVLLCGKRAVDGSTGPPFIGGIFDVSERRRLEEQLRHAQKMEAVGQLTAGIAHNFNNLLTVIIPSIQLLRRELPVATGDRLRDVEHAASRAAELVKQLMVFARYPHAAPRVPTDMVALVQRTVAICRATFDRSVVMVVSSSPNLPAAIGDAGALEQVLLNMCLNARDAVENGRASGREIRIQLDTVPRDSSQPAFVRIRISDNGSGMTEEVRARIFEPFFTTKEAGRGSGLGLATAYAIVSEHQGSISCQSSPGVGTTFVVLLPAGSEPVRRSSERALVLEGGQETILVIDDEPLVRKAVRSVLEPVGYTVLEAGDGRSGLETFRRAGRKIDLVLLDRSMPGASGDEVLVEIRREHPGTRVVLFTGYGPHVLPTGAAALVNKPVQLVELLRVVREVCSR